MWAVACTGRGSIQNLLHAAHVSTVKMTIRNILWVRLLMHNETYILVDTFK